MEFRKSQDSKLSRPAVVIVVIAVQLGPNWEGWVNLSLVGHTRECLCVLSLGQKFRFLLILYWQRTVQFGCGTTPYGSVVELLRMFRNSWFSTLYRQENSVGGHAASSKLFCVCLKKTIGSCRAVYFWSQKLWFIWFHLEKARVKLLIALQLNLSQIS